MACVPCKLLATESVKECLVVCMSVCVCSTFYFIAYTG